MYKLPHSLSITKLLNNERVHIVGKIYTPCPKKACHLMFDNNFGNCGPIFKILSPGDL